jgi:RNA polymerase sigma-70 factor (ECF subfamily)
MIIDKEQYITELYERNVDRIYKICYIYFKGNKSDIEDAIQTIFIKILEKEITFENLNHEKAWFIVTTNNYCKNKVKHWWNKNKELDFDVKDEIKNDELINKVLNLPDKYKVPIYMHYYEGYSCVEISKILKINENTIYSYLHKGRNILKIMIEEENNE